MAKQKLPRWVEEHVPSEVSSSSMFIFKVKFQNGVVTTINLLTDLDIDYEILEEQLETVAAQYMFWSTVYSELKTNVSTKEIAIKARRSSLAATAIEQARKDNVRLTEKQLTAITENDQSITKLEAELAIAHKHAGKVYHMVEAIRIKSENCRSLAGFKRQDKEQSGQTP
jgi:hypothetical protein